jgi:hypothetical protein
MLRKNKRSKEEEIGGLFMGRSCVVSEKFR